MTYTSTINKKPSNKLLLVSTFGNIIEYFDNALIASIGILVFPYVFYPANSNYLQMLFSSILFALSFLSRPIGSLIFGHMGDTKGRKITFCYTLILMGLATLVIGLLPSFNSIGILAPIILIICRLLQGVAIGGEGKGGMVYVMESSKGPKRFWYSMFPALGSPVGNLLSTFVVALLTTFFTQEDLKSYAWRIPFILSAVLVFIALLIRSQLDESEEFLKLKKDKKIAKYPLKNIFSKYYKSMISSSLAGIISGLIGYTILVFLLGYSVSSLHYKKDTILYILTIGTFLQLVFTLCAGHLTTKFTIEKILIYSSVLIMVLGLFLGTLISLGMPGFIIFSLIGMSLSGINNTIYMLYSAKIFPTEVRYSGSSMSSNFSAVLGSAFAPLIATYLNQHYSLNGVGAYIAVGALISFLPVVAYKTKTSTATK